jgi:uncharacterized alkaline shock family protein YloU
MVSGGGEMSEQDQRQAESPLVGERGRTTISDSVVSQIAGMAAQEVDGVHMGGSASRAAGGILGSITGSEGQGRGISVEVGATEVAVDLTMGVEYGRNIMEVVEEVRRRISERVQSLTGLRVTELNATISDIVFPENGVQRRRALGSGTASAGQRPEPRTMPRQELRPGAGERETTEVSPRNRTRTESASGPVPEEEVRVEGRPLPGDETAELEPEDVSGTRRPSGDDETTRRIERPEER